jgi:predicted permease
MSWRREFSKIQNLFRRYKPIDDVDEEIRAHLKMEEQANRESGMSPEDAYYAARQRFGNITIAQETSREMWGWNSVEVLFQDLRYGLRQLRRNPGFAAAAVFALTFGIGVNTAVFTAYKAMVGRPLDARDPGEMVNIALIRDDMGNSSFNFSYPDYEAYRDSVHSFTGLIAFGLERMRFSSTGGIVGQRSAAADSGPGLLGLPSSPVSNAEFASVYAVSENYFKVLGVAALRGRTFDSIGIPELVASPSILISENYWQRRFAGDPAVLGKIIHLNSVAVTVVGITPHDFVGTGIGAPDFWLPLCLEPLVHKDDNWLHDRENQRFRLFGRLASGVSINRARAEVATLADHLRSLHDPRSNAAKPATASVWLGSPFPLPLKMYRGLTLTILLIMSAAGMVLLIACANVACLQLARARSRQAELHTRLSLGASRLRIVRQLLTESALLGLAAGTVALPFTWALLRVGVVLATRELPPDVMLVFDVTPDLQIFGFVFAISLVSGILFGLAPAMENSRSTISSAVRGGTAPLRSHRIQDLLIAAQVALSLVLMIAGSMLIRSSINSLKKETGYDSKHVVDLNFQFPEGSKYNVSRRAVLVQELRTRLAAIPGVAAITSARAPDENSFRTAAVPLDGEKSSTPNGQSILHYTYIQANYFQTLGIPLSVGRSFQMRRDQPEHSVILSESAAKQLWPGQNPVGRSLSLGPTDERLHNQSELFADGPAYQVIGIARDIRGVEFDGSDSKQVYLPLPKSGLQDHPILIRSQSDPVHVIRAINPVISSIDPDLTITALTLQEMLRWSTPFISSRLAAAVASAVGLIGLLLATMGIYGTVSYVVVLRTREVGIRMAVGAQKRDILGLILYESTRPVLGGLLVGMFLAVGASYLLRGVLYGLNTIDGVSFLGVSLLFFAIALLAAYPPSRRAMRVDPIVALRYE